MSLPTLFLAKQFGIARARFDGAAVWATLDSAQQAKIGAVALELFVNHLGEDAYCLGGEPTINSRPFEAAAPLLDDMLTAAIADTLEAAAPALFETLF